MARDLAAGGTFLVDRNPLTALLFPIRPTRRSRDAQAAEIRPPAIPESRTGGAGKNRIEHGRRTASARALARRLQARRGAAQVLPVSAPGCAAAGQGAGGRHPEGLQE